MIPAGRGTPHLEPPATAFALAPIAALDPIALDELNASAELLTRVDRKYMLPASALPSLLERLPRGTLALEIGGTRSARYDSVYFDTSDLESYHLAAYGRRRRYKIRTRSYVDSDASFLEVKTRGGRAVTVKERVSIDPSGTTSLQGDALDYATATLGEAGIRPPEHEPFVPVLTTRYRRATLLVPGGTRATIDVDLEWIEHGAHARTLSTPRSVIVETKSGGSAGPIDRTLWSLGHRPTTVSKFGTGLAALRPGLPANRWAPVLRAHFAQAMHSPAAPTAAALAGRTTITTPRKDPS
ncbi:VTC domain-containing protein [Agromyces sp. CF514]|uniref:polyphosphate polymerase domain-containing protein n=1 Tax=Agromyces sp. CF514 TaxID=1881031 RepID=UPI0008E8C754|nr:polyphosphate polymerase domain-containing protein [Agromyces sp. CF514]SFR83029.1 VTC domain-containing protein [Agromyces sp. CF514]